MTAIRGNDDYPPLAEARFIPPAPCKAAVHPASKRIG